MDNWLCTNIPHWAIELFSGECIVLSTNIIETIGCPQKKKIFRTSHYSEKITPNICYLYIRPKTNPAVENIGENLCDYGLGKEFLAMTKKAESLTGTLIHFTSSKLSFCAPKYTHTKERKKEK